MHAPGSGTTLTTMAAAATVTVAVLAKQNNGTFLFFPKQTFSLEDPSNKVKYVIIESGQTKKIISRQTHQQLLKSKWSVRFKVTVSINANPYKNIKRNQRRREYKTFSDYSIRFHSLLGTVSECDSGQIEHSTSYVHSKWIYQWLDTFKL